MSQQRTTLRPVRPPSREVAQQTAQPESAASKLFDLRVLIGGLFTLYGVVLIVAGIVAGAADTHKASGIPINVWMGIGMLVLGLLFLLWWRLQPLPPPGKPARDTDIPGAPLRGEERDATPRDGRRRRRGAAR